MGQYATEQKRPNLQKEESKMKSTAAKNSTRNTSKTTPNSTSSKATTPKTSKAPKEASVLSAQTKTRTTTFEIKQQKHTVKMRNILLSLTCALVVLFVAIGAVCGYVFSNKIPDFVLSPIFAPIRNENKKVDRDRELEKQFAFWQDPKDHSYKITNNLNEKTETVVIPSFYRGQPVTGLSDYLFSNNKNLKAVVFEDNAQLEFISTKCFEGCSSLTSIVIPTSVTSIKTKAFAQSGLQNLTFKDGSTLTTIGEKAFQNTNLRSVYLPDSLKSIENNAFEGNENLTTVRFGKSLNTIGVNVFRSTSIDSLTLPENFTSLTEYSFAQETTLKVVDLSKTKITSIPAHAFEGSSITKIIVPQTLIEIGESAFASSTLVEFVVQTNDQTQTNIINVDTIGANAFLGCGFTKNTNNEPYDLKITAKQIGANAFSNLSVESIYLTTSQLQSIGQKAFASCQNLSNFVTSMAGNFETANVDFSLFDDCPNISSAFTIGQTLLVGPAMIQLNSADIIIHPSFEQTLTSVVFLGTSHLSTIAQNAFENSSFSQITLPNSVTTIQKEAFKNCTSLNQIQMPSVTNVGANAFYGCTSLSLINFSNITNISSGTFDGCSSLNQITLSNNLQTIGAQAFRYCTSLGSITIPSTTQTIGSEAFWGCRALSSISISDQPALTTIGDGAFYNCVSLSNALLPSSLTTLGNNAFYNCSNISSITIPGSLTEIPQNAFAYCTGLSTVNFANNSQLSTISSYAFAYCTNLSKIIFPSSLQNLNGEGIFASCNKLAQIIFLGTSAPSATSSLLQEWQNLPKFENIFVPSAANYSQFPKAEQYAATIGTTGLQYQTENGTQFTITGYTGSATQITINPYMFDGTTVFKTTKIANEAIKNTSITSIELPKTLQEIGSAAFKNCSALTSISIPASVSTMGTNPFENCLNLATITVSDQSTTLTFADNCLIKNGNTLVAAINNANIVPNQVTTVGEYAFANCPNITKIVLGQNVSALNNNALSANTQIEQLIINSNYAVVLGQNSLPNNLTNIFVPQAQLVAYQSDWSAQKDLLMAFTINCGTDGLKFTTNDSTQTATITGYTGTSASVEIGTWVLKDNNIYKITEISSLKSSVITSINFGSSVEKISSVFLENLQTLFIPKQIVSIGSSFVTSSQGLTSIEVDPQNTIYSSQNNCLIATATKELLVGCKGSTLPTDGSVTTIKDSAFAHVPITSISFPSSITTIEDKAFAYSGLTSVSIPSTITNFGNDVFTKSSSLTSVTFQTGTTIVPHGAFYCCETLESVTLSSTITTIGKGAFALCESLKSMTIPKSVTEIQASAFENCTSMNRIYIYPTVPPVPLDQSAAPAYHIFDGCDDLVIFVPRDSLDAYMQLTSTNWGWKNLEGFNTTVGSNGLVYSSDSFSEIQIIGYNGTSSEVTINETIIMDGQTKSVTSIKASAFNSNKTITKVNLPSTIKSIGSSAFANCTNLTSITIPAATTSLAENTFWGCTLLTNLSVASANSTYATVSNCLINKSTKTLIQGFGTPSIPTNGSVTKIAQNAFSYCPNLKTITIPSAITTINTQAFNNCTNLQSVEFAAGGSVTIGASAFANCSKLQTLTLSTSVTSIGNFAFDGAALTTVTIPSSVTSIGTNPFRSCQLESIFVDSSNKKYASKDIIDYMGETNSLVRKSDGVIITGTKNTNRNTVATEIGDYAFYELSGLTSFPQIKGFNFLGKSLIFSKIGNYAFYGCLDLETVVLPTDNDAKITTIGQYAFAGCPSLKSATLPSTVTSIGRYAFANDTALTQATILSTTMPTTPSTYSVSPTEVSTSTMPTTTIFDGCTSLQNIYVLNNLVSTFKTNWSNVSLKISGIATTIGTSGLTYTLNSSTQTAIITGYTGTETSVVINDIFVENGVLYNTTAIAANAFKNKSITTITLPSTLTTIGASAFEGCTSLGAVVASDAVTSIGERAFYGCTSLTTFSTSSNYTSSLITIPASLKTLGEGAFAYCSSISNISVASGNTNFYWGNNYLVDTTTKTLLFALNATDLFNYAPSIIGKYAFSTCTSLTTITIPQTVTKINDYAFSNCTSLESIILTGSAPSLGSDVFASALNQIFICKDYFSSFTSTSGWSGLSALFQVYEFENSVSNKLRYTFSASGATITSVQINEKQELVITPYVFSYGSVVGNGNMYKVFAIRESVFDSNKYITAVRFPYGSFITELPASVFARCEALTYVQIPASIKTISKLAFNKCPSLSEVAFDSGSSLSYIGANAFQGCTSITSISLPQTLTEIGESAFRSTGLTSINLPQGLKTIGAYAFAGIKALTSATFSNSLTTISNYAFSYTNLTSITLPSSLTTIGTRAFENTQITSVTIPASVTNIGINPFKGCPLASIVVEDDNTKYTSGGNDQMNVVVELATYKVVIGAKNPNMYFVREIGDYAFYGMDLTSVSLAGVQTIGSYAFAFCSNLSSVDFNSSLTTIGSYAFSGCGHLTTVIILSSSVPTAGLSVFLSCQQLESIYVPSSLLSSYKSSSNWSSYSSKFVGVETTVGTTGLTYTLDSTNKTATITGYTGSATDVSISGLFVSGSNVYKVVSIADSAFKSSKITSITLPSTITTIGNYAFKSCTSLASATLNEGITQIGNQAFDGCTSLATVNIPSTLTSWGTESFQRCTSLVSITIPATISIIPAGAFYGCTNLAEITFESGSKLETISDKALFNTGLLSITIPASVTTITYGAIAENSQLQTLTFEANSQIQTIGDSAFDSCTALTTVTLPAHLAELGGNPFRSCKSIETLYVENGNAVYKSESNCIIKISNNELISGCKGSTIPSTVVIIGKEAFEGIPLTKVILPESITEIKDYAFGRCDTLTKITLTSPNVITAGSSIFINCNALTEILVEQSLYETYKTASGWSIYSDLIYTYSTTAGTTGLSYNITSSTNKTASVTGYSGSSTDVVVSDYLKSGSNYYKITSMYTSYSSALSKITSLTLPSYLASYKASNYLTNLATIQMRRNSAVYTAKNNCLIYTPSKKLVLGATNSTIPSDGTVEIIGDYSFAGRNITSITIPEMVKTIQYCAFDNCTNLKTVNISSTVTVIGGQAFERCKNLSTLSVDSSNATFVSSGNCIIKTDTKTLVVGSNSSVIPTDGSVTKIGNYAFSGRNISSISLPSSITQIGDYAFSWCDNLREITIPANVSEIGKEAFYYRCSIIEFLSTTTIPTISNTSLSVAAVIIVPTGSLKSYTEKFVGIDSYLKNKIYENPTATTVGTDGLQYNLDSKNHTATIIGYTGTSAEIFINPVFRQNGQIYISTDMSDNTFIYNKTIKYVTLPNTMDNVPSAAFKGCTNLVSVVLPDGILSVYESAFENCTSLTTVQFPSNMDDGKICERAFYGCTSLKNLYLPKNLKGGTIGDYSFFGCTSLTELTIPADISDIGSYAFSHCENLSKLVFLPTTGDYFLKYLGTEAFSYNRSITELVLPSMAEYGSMEDFCFANWKSLKTVNLNGNHYIGKGTFYNCRQLEEVIAPLIRFTSQTPEIGDVAFANCVNLKYFTSYMVEPYKCVNPTTTFENCDTLAYMAIPLTSVYDSYFGSEWKDIFHDNIYVGAMSDYKNYKGEVDLENQTCTITSYTGSEENITIYPYVLRIISNSSNYDEVKYYKLKVTTIADSAFADSKIASISLPNTIESIGGKAFANCQKLTAIKLPSSLKTLGAGAFLDCGSLTLVQARSTIPPTGLNSTTFNTQPIIQVSVESYEAYKAAEFWRDQNIQPIKEDYLGTDGLQATYSSTENGNTAAITGYTGNATDITIVPYVYHGGVVYAVTEIYSNVFATSPITSINLPKTLKIIGGYEYDAGQTDGAFYKCTELKSITIPASVTTIERGAFMGSGISKITFEEGSNLSLIEHEAFVDCTNLYSIILPNGLTTIDGKTFVGCTSLTSVVLPNSLTTIDGSAFAGCISLTTITIPASVTSVGETIFEECTNLTKIYMLGTVPPTQINQDDYCALDGLKTDYKVIVPTGCGEVYKSAVNWKKFAEHIEEKNQTYPDVVGSLGLTYEIDETNKTITITGCSDHGIRNVEIYPYVQINGQVYTVTAISNDAFAENNQIQSVIIPNTIKTIGQYAFRCCFNLTKVTFQSGSALTEIPLGCFGETAIKSVTIPASIKTIAAGAFCYCYDLAQVKFESDSSLVEIAKHAFDENKSLKSIVLPASLKAIGEYAFYNPAGTLTSIVFEDNSQLVSIGKAAFQGCGISKIVFTGTKLTSFGDSAFTGCINLKEIYFTRAIVAPEIPNVDRVFPDLYNATIYVTQEAYENFKSSAWTYFQNIKAI